MHGPRAEWINYCSQDRPVEESQNWECQSAFPLDVPEGLRSAAPRRAGGQHAGMGRGTHGSTFRSGGAAVDRAAEALPTRLQDEGIFWGYHFVTGALLLTLARTGRIDKLSGGLCKSEDFAEVKKRMAKFMAGGFRALCGT
jgi:tetracycline repressor-like protein